MNTKLKALLAVLLVAGLLLIPSPGDAYLGEWLDDYNYRKLIPITNATGAGTDYLVPLEVHSGVGTDSNGIVHLGATKDTAFESYITGDDSYIAFAGASWEAQTFTPSIEHTIGYVRLKLYRTGSPGIVTVSIRATAGDDPTGDDLCSESINGNTLTTDTNGTWYDFFLGVGSVLSADTKYAIVIRAPDGSAGNTSSWRGDEFSTGYAGGEYRASPDSGTNWGLGPNGVDFMFEEGTSNNYCTDFPNDIRFTDNDGDTELDHRVVDDTADPATFKIEIADDLGNNQNFYIYWGKSGAGSGVTEFREDFYADYLPNEVDPNNHLAVLEGTPYHLESIVAVNEDAYMYDDKGVDYFTDFEHWINLRINSTPDNDVWAVSWMLANDIGGYWGLKGASETIIIVRPYYATALGARIYLTEAYGGSEYNDHYNAALDTDYYLLIKKVGTDLKVGIYSTAGLRSAGDATDGDFDNLALTLHADHKFQYVYPANSLNFTGALRQTDLDIDDLFMRFIVDPEPVVGTPGNLETREISWGYIIG